MVNGTGRRLARQAGRATKETAALIGGGLKKGFKALGSETKKRFTLDEARARKAQDLLAGSPLKKKKSIISDIRELRL